MVNFTHQDDPYYARGQNLATKLIERMRAEPANAELYARIWVPASLAGASATQKLGFLDAADKAQCKELDAVIFASIPFLLASPKTFEDKVALMVTLKQYYTRFCA